MNRTFDTAHRLGMWSLTTLLLGALVRQSWATVDVSDQAPLQAGSSRSSRYGVLKSDLIAFHKNLTQIESITFNEKEVGEWLASSLKDQGYHVEKQYVDEESGRFNVYAYPGDVRKTRVLVSSHIDTVRFYD